MSEAASSRLTEREAEALRLVATHPSLNQIALAMGLSRSRVQQLMASAGSKLGVRNRYEAARVLAAQEGRRFALEHRIGANDQIGDVAKIEPSPSNSSWAPLIEVAVQALGRRGDSNDLTQRQRFNRTLVIALITLIALSVLAASLGALGNFGQGLHERGIHHI